ncbi:MAG: hypothetical protein JWM86_2512 [Thermoleophilia bacterium]|nr:hypothetical protein [Thermoleophilia bacterium]
MHVASTTPSAAAAAIAAKPAAPAPKVDAPAFTGGIDFAGAGRFKQFAAHATDVVYGPADGYAGLQEAIDAVTFLTIGARETAAGIFERDGRFHARKLDNAVTFSSGATWKGAWRLEQFPADLELIDGSAKGTTTRAAELVAVVDGAQRHDVSTLPVAT